MSQHCQDYRPRLMAMLFEEIEEEERRALESHLANCPPCRDELAASRQVVEQLRTPDDEPVPRHFFVYAKQPLPMRWRWLTPGRLGGLAAAAVLLVLLVGAGFISQLQFRAGNGTLLIGWGELPPVQPQWDPEELRSELIQQVALELQKRDAEWLGRLTSTVDEQTSNLDSEQRQRFGRALAALERRQSEQHQTRIAALESDFENNLYRVLKTVELRHQGDLDAVRSQLELMAVSGQIKDTQNDALLTTLFQMADLRLQD